MTRRYSVMIGLAVWTLCAACASPHKNTLDDIEALAARGERDTADARYASFLKGTSLEDDEWRAVVESRCAVREQIVTSRREELAAKGDPPTRAELLELLHYSRLCASSSSQDEALLAQMIARTEADVEREIQPLYASKSYGAMLARAPDFMPYLPADHRYATWFAQVREAMAKNWSTRSEEELAAGRLMASFYLSMLADDAKLKTPQSAPPAEAIKKMQEASEQIAMTTLTAFLVQLDVVQGSDVCTPRLMPLHRVDTGIITSSMVLPTRAKLTFSSCAMNVSAPDAVGGQTTLTIKGEASLLSRLDGAETDTVQTIPVELVLARSFGQAMTSDEAINAFFEPGSNGISEADQALVKVIVAHVRTMYDLEQAGASFHHMSTQVANPQLAMEHLLAAFFTTHQLSDQEAEIIAAAFGPDPRSFPSSALVPVFSWYDPWKVETTMPRNILTREESAAALNEGLPAMGAIVSAEFGLPEQDLVGQPDRSALGVSFDTPMRWSLLKGSGFFRGAGLVVGTELGVHVGKRFGQDYQDVTSPGDIPPYEPDEEFGSFGFHADAVAMVGRRGERLGLFVGARPGFVHRSFGFYKTQGGRLPLAARLEWRGLRGVVLEGWWGGFSARNDNTSMGARLIVQGPAQQGSISSGLVLGAQQDVLPAHFFGLNQRDRVRLEQATLTTASVGYWYGF